MNKQKIFMAFEIVLLLAVVFFLFKISIMFKERYEAFDANPFLFGAGKYNIASCSCITESGGSFFFNKDKMWKEAINKPMEYINISMLESIFKESIVTNGTRQD